jgi:hypothetical protein
MSYVTQQFAQLIALSKAAAALPLDCPEGLVAAYADAIARQKAECARARSAYKALVGR